MSWPVAMRPQPIWPTRTRLLGASAPRRREGMNMGMARVAPAAAAVRRNRRRVMGVFMHAAPLTGGLFPARIMRMIIPLRDRVCKALILSLFVSLPAISASADWQREDNSIAWRTGTYVVWRFSF